MREINQVRTQITVRARACDLLLQAPYQRERRIDDPILQEPSTEVVDLAETAALHEFLRQLYRWCKTIVEADHVLHASFFSRC
ncbi:hypothetical protein D3C86_1966840 [compost metagenome]